MAAEGEEIHIRFRVDTSELERAVGLLEQLLGPLQKFQASAREFTVASQEMGAGLGDVRPGLDLFKQKILEVGKALGVPKEDLGKFRTEMLRLSRTSVAPEVEREALRRLKELTGIPIGELRKGLKDLRQAYREFTGIDVRIRGFRELPTQTAAAMASLSPFRDLVRNIGISFGLSGKKLEKFTDDMLILAAVRLPRPEFEAYVERISKATGIGASDIKKYVTAIRTEMNKLPGVMSKQAAEAARLARAQDPILQKYDEFRRLQMALRGAMGGFLYSLRTMSHQLYWLGIGLMFVTMSFTRVQERMVTQQSRLLSLARAYASVTEAERELNETMIEYGKGSEEYNRAAGRLLESKMALRLAIEQTRMAVLQEQLGWIQLGFGILPVAINAFRMGIDVYYLLFARKLANVVADKLVASSTKQTASAQMALIPWLYRSAGAFKVAGKSALIAGIEINKAQALAFAFVSMGVSLAISAAMVAWAMGEAERQTAELRKEMESLGEALSGNIDEIEKWDEAIAGRSLVSSALAGSEAVRELHRSLLEIESPPELEQTVVTRRVLVSRIPGIEPEATQLVRRILVEDISRLETVRQNVVRVLEVDIPEVEDVYQRVTREIVEERPLEGTLGGRVLHGGGNTYYVNVSFPNLIIREEADIFKIRDMIDSIFQREYYAGGGD